MSATKTTTVTVPEDVTVTAPSANTLRAGTYRVEMPVDYEPELVTGVDILSDDALRIVGED